MDLPHPFESKELSSVYKSFRPHYPKDVFEAIVEYYKTCHESFSLALDIGCGTGLSTVPLAKYFKEVIGVDPSEAQLSNADRSKANVSYRIGKAEDLSFCEPGSVDLITLMATFHWIDREAFYREVQRVLKPNGVLAVCTYWYDMDLGLPEATKALCKEFLVDVLVKQGYAHRATQLIPEMYAENFIIPFKDFKRNTEILMTENWSLHQLTGYVRSIGAYDNYTTANPNSTVLQEIIQRLKQIFKVTDEEDVCMTATWPLCLLLARK